MKKLLLSSMLAVASIGSAQITTSGQYTPSQLVNDILIAPNTVVVSNISASTGINFGSVNGLGSFDQNGTDFPFDEGIILSTGSITTAQGPNTTLNSGGNDNWPGDTDLYQMLIGQTTANTMNATSLEFDFYGVGDQLIINYIFAAEEYGASQCSFSDSFAIILTDLSTGTNVNLGIIPGTTIPVSVVTVRDNAFNGDCSSMNPEFFDTYYSPTDAGAPVNFNGITVPMSAEAAIIPGHNYHIKFVIADRADSSMDSALFISDFSANIGVVDIEQPIDLTVCDGDGDGISTFNLTDNTSVLLGGADPDNFIITYYETAQNAEEGVFPIANPEAFTNASPFEQTIYVRAQSTIISTYYQTAYFSVIASALPYAGDVEEIVVLDTDTDGSAIVDLTSSESQILAGASPNGYEIYFYTSQANAETGAAAISNPASFTMSSSTVYFRMENIETGCYVVEPLEVVVLPSDYVTEEPDGASSQTFTTGETLASLEVEGENIQWYATAGSTAGRDANDNDDIPLPMSTPLQDNTTYYATQTVYGIESVERFPVTAHASLGVNEDTFTSLTYYPNPVKDVLTLSNNEIIEEVVAYNLLGQEVLRKTINERTTSLNLSSITGGIYIVKVTSEGVEKTFKILKE